jgi:hypothetical protein
MTTTAVEATAPDTPREARFTAAVQRLRTRVDGAAVERWFRVAGPVMMPLGALMVVLAWWGSANTTRVFLQIPYLISGAILGLGFMFVGGFVYFARWQSDLIDAVRAESRRADEAERRTAAALERIEALLRTTTAPVAPTVVTPAPASADQATAEPSGDRLVVTPHGKLVHLADCRLVEGRAAQPVGPGDLAERGVCRICLPGGVDV